MVSTKTMTLNKEKKKYRMIVIKSIQFSYTSQNCHQIDVSCSSKTNEENVTDLYWVHIYRN